MNKATVQALLDDPRVWRARRGDERRPTLPSGYPELDALLPGGGWPAARLTEIAVERWGSGELALLVPLLVRLSADEAPTERHWIAWISPPFLPYAPALAAAGIDIGRLLLVRAGDDAATLWAAEQALRSCSCRLVLAWAGQAGATGLRRLQLAAEAGGTTLILFRPLAALAAPSAAALRLSLAGGQDGARLRLRKHRGEASATVSLATLQGR
jgi:hypothetical protein